MPRVTFDGFSLRIEGERRLIRSAALHYFRLPSEALWRDRIAKLRDAGFNAVLVPYPWSFHCEEPGRFDFSGPRDVDRLHELIQEAGLFLLARPGPWLGASLDLGGLPGWLLRTREATLRCRTRDGFSYSREFMAGVRGWFEAILPRIARARNLILLELEHCYTLPTPYAGAREDLFDLVVRLRGVRGALRWVGGERARRRGLEPSLGRAEAAVGRGQTNPYLRELGSLARELGVGCPIFHTDLSPRAGRRMDVELPALARAVLGPGDRDWRERVERFEEFRGDEAALRAHREGVPLVYGALTTGQADPWGGVGYAVVRERLGQGLFEQLTLSALAEGATVLCFEGVCGGTNVGYLASPDVYTSYDLGAPLPESEQPGAALESLRRWNEFLERHEAALCLSRPVVGAGWCPEHVARRRAPDRRFEFLRSAHARSRGVPVPEPVRAELAPFEAQLRVYDAGRRLCDVSPPPPSPRPLRLHLPPPLPRLERFRFACVSPQLFSSYDDSSWSTIPQGASRAGRLDMDSLGLHYGFVWYRGRFRGPLDRLALDARHCYAVWLDGRLIASGDQLRNPLGIGPDGARSTRLRSRVLEVAGGERESGDHTLVILVESLGHNQGIVDDGGLPRGLVRIDAGSTEIWWRFRGGLLRGEAGITPRVSMREVERRGGKEEVVLPHGWEGAPEGVALYETRFRLEGIDPKLQTLCLSFDPGRGKANLYLNGALIGRYWPERGPQRRFLLPWGLLHASEENHLAVALWKRATRAALGKLRLEVV